MRRGFILAVAILALVVLLSAAGCAVPGTRATLSTKVATADSLLANKYASAWWSEKFGGGKHDAALINSVQGTIGMDVSTTLSSGQKSTDVSRLSAARQTLSQLQADKVLSQADVNKVLAAITDIETVISKQ
jgi:hypothetical protein